MKLIVGLGNPGGKYAKTRHNVGFMVVDELAKKMTNGQWLMVNKLQSLIINHSREAGSRFAGQSSIILAKPQTMMNASGFAVSKLLTMNHLPLFSLWIIHDDLDLPLGKIKIRFGGGTAGHHGLESIVKQLGTTDFVRFRLGIGHPGVADEDKHREVERYVLEEFSGKEKVEAKKMIGKATEALKLALEEGIEAAMNKFNLK